MQRQEDRSREAIILSVLGPVRIRDDGIVVLFKDFFSDYSNYVWP